ncbi:MAG: RNA polymerase sigma factor [Planctomycetota bacterium]|nr:RNA polymerase sigma factor [Planctomycetota bacterium]
MIPLGSIVISDSLELQEVEPNDLVRRLQAGCSDSATELSNRFTPRLLILLERRLQGNRADAEDVAQEALAKAFQRLDQFDFQYQFSTWLYTIAFRLATDFARKEKRRPKLVPMEAMQLDTLWRANGDFSNAEAVVEDVWSVARSALSESQYTSLWLRYGEGLSIQEIAGIMNKTQIVIRVQLHRARSRLEKDIRRMDRERMVNQGNPKEPS